MLKLSLANRLNSLVSKLLVIIVLMSIFSLLWYLINTIWQTDNSNNINNNYTSNYSYVVDTKSSMSVDELLTTPEKFSRSSASKIPFTLNGATYWIKIKVTNNINNAANLVLHADNPMLDVFDVYQINNNTNSLVIPNVTSSIIQAVFPHKLVHLPASASEIFILKLKSNGPPNIPIHLYNESSFYDRVHISLGLFGSFVGVIMLMSVYNLVLYIGVKDKVYLIYIGYLLSSFFVLATVNGFGFFIFPETIQLWLTGQTLLFHYLLVICLILFALFYLRYNTTKNSINQVGLSLCIFLVFLYIIGNQFSSEIQAKIFFGFQPILYIFCIYIVFKRINKDYSWAKFYFISWIPLLIGAAVQPLMLLNYIEYSFVNRNAFLLGMMVELGFMALALAERMRRNEQDQLHHLCYHSQTGLPRQLNLENTIKNLTASITKKQDLVVVVLKPEHIEKIKHYVDDDSLLQLFKNINNNLSALFKHNDAVLPLTFNNEKLCYINGKCLGCMVDISKLSIPIHHFIQSIQQIITETYSIKDLTLSLTGVVGVSHYPNHGLTSKELVKHGLIAIHEAENTPEKWAVYQIDKTDKSTFLLELASDIQYALEHKVFEIYHQPQIDLKTSKVCGSECLIRWNHPTKGFIGPSIFIPVAEDMGLINQITLWVIKQSLFQHATIIEDKQYNHMVSINISGIDIISKNFYEQTVTMINDSNVPPDKVIFEITESANIAKNEHAVQVIEKLTAFGVTVSIDDFGTGYSSLANLDDLPFQELKIDKRFVDNVHQDSKRQVITETTIKMAKGVGLEVVAEGITSALDESALIKYGCDIGQGYYYAEAMPIHEYLEWLSVQKNGKTPQHYYGEFIPAEEKS